VTRPYREAARYYHARPPYSADLRPVLAAKLGWNASGRLLGRQLCGEGALDVTSFIRAIRATGFEGPWGVEILSDEHRKRSLQDQVTKSYATTIRQFRLANGTQ
jgi:hypothetical protein